MTMEEMKKEQMTKTQVFNVIILDRSGSMSSIRHAAVSSFNETLAGIRKAQEKFAETQDHYVTLVTFCSCHTDTVFDKVPVKEARPLDMNDYEPCCCTPLYDAMGFTITGMRDYVKKIDDAVVVVTIITDGLENDSKEYSGAAIKSLVESLRTEGWTFTYMGANQDSIEVSMSLSIRNARNFAYSEAGIHAGMKKENDARMNFYGRVQSRKQSARRGESISKADWVAEADAAFDEEEAKNK